MGEHNMHSSLRARRARNLTAGLAAAALGLTLTSCSAIGLTAHAQGSSDAPSAPSSAAVVDPSVSQASETPSAAASTPTTGDSPTPTPTPSASTPSKTVTPFITLAQSSGGDVEVSALIPRIVEQGGTCTLVVTKDGTTRRAVSAAAPASSYTGCNPLAVPASALSSGTWTVQVSYLSATAAGSSSTQSVKVG